MIFKLRESSPLIKDPIERLLYTRGLETREDMQLFLEPNSSAEIDYHQLDNIELAARRLLKALVRQEEVYVQVDSDCDGYTSAAALLNYMHDIAPVTVERKWTYGLHRAKLHGIDRSNIGENTALVVAPDSSSNEQTIHQELNAEGIDVVVLDHHEADNTAGDPAIIVNNQLCGYPNKFLSGVGIVYKVLQCIDDLRHEPGNADNYLDLVALGLTGDMMDMKSLETRFYITEGFEWVKNPFFKYLADKNEYSMKGVFTPHSVAWYIVPFINAVTRVGNNADKLLVFESMLSWKAGELVPSDKRGARPGTEELRVVKAVRHASNIKSHQDTDKKNLLAAMEEKIAKYNLLEDPVLIIQNKGVEDDDPVRGITGLVANSLMAKYGKPTLILNEIVDPKTGKITWSGSGRGFATTDINNWRDYIVSTGTAIFAEGHPFAFGVAFTSDGLEWFKNTVKSKWGSTPFVMSYDVDYIWTMHDEFDNIVMTIGEYENIWGQGVPEPLVVIEHIKIKDDVKLNLLSKGTLRLDLYPHKTNCIKFGSNADEYESLIGKTITILGTCSINEWNGNRTPQIQIKDYFIESVPVWDF